MQKLHFFSLAQARDIAASRVSRWRATGSERVEVAPEDAPNILAVNFRITDEVSLGQGSETQKYNDNIAAISALKTIERENRRTHPKNSASLRAMPVAVALRHRRRNSSLVAPREARRPSSRPVPARGADQFGTHWDRKLGHLRNAQRRQAEYDRLAALVFPWQALKSPAASS